ncbi:MAG: hypothetical protein ABFE07_20555, partial [Armatimonadia bacterium]
MNLQNVPIDDDVIVERASEPVTPMPEPVEVPFELSRYGQPDSIWVYRLDGGEAVGAVMRWNREGGKSKVIRPVIWDGEAFVSRSLGSGRPPLNAPMIAAAPTADVLLVEGEKTADAAAAYLPENFCVTTWSGGANAWKNTDFSILAGRVVVIWPDNDDAGK